MVPTTLRRTSKQPIAPPATIRVSLNNVGWSDDGGLILSMKIHFHSKPIFIIAEIMAGR